MAGLQEFVQEHGLRLESIHIRVRAKGERYSRKYTRQRNVLNDLVSWEVEYCVYAMPQFWIDGETLWSFHSGTQRVYSSSLLSRGLS